MYLALHMEGVIILGIFNRNLLSIAVISLSSFAMTGCGADNSATPEWETHFSGNDAEDRIEWINTINQDAFGDLITAGETILMGSNRSENAFVVKHDTAGNLLWKSQFDINDGSYDTDENVTDVAVDDDGNTYVVGNIYQREGAPSTYTEFLLKVNRYGKQAWVQTFSDQDKTWDVEFTNNLIYVAGDATRVFDTDGNLQLEIDQAGEAVWDVEVDSVGNIYTSGHAFVAKHDSAGNQIWKINNPSEIGHASDIAINSYDEVYVAHHIYADDRYRIAKISADGTPLWERYISDPSSSAGAMDGIPNIKLDHNENIIVIASNTQGRKLVKLDQNGSTVWSKSASGGIVRSLTVDASNNIYIFGKSTGEKFDSNGSSKGTLKVSGGSNDTTGDAIVVGSNIYVGTSVMVDGSFTGYLANFKNP